MDEETVYALCDWCELPIRFGNAMATVQRSIEQVDSTESHPDGEVTVIDAEALLTLCARCGNRLDAHLLRSGAPATG